MYKVLFAILKLLSRLPLRVHYLLSDVLLYPLVFHVVRYRRRLVRRQLAECFPEKSEQERRQIMRRFYHFLCDYIVETLKMQTMSHDELRQLVPFVRIVPDEIAGLHVGDVAGVGILATSVLSVFALELNADNHFPSVPFI